ncbi:unnamed protein product [Urochloa humidicola]
MDSSSSSSRNTNPFAAEAVAISASVAQLINIKSHVPVTLDQADPSFTTWRTFFHIALRKFGLMDHIDGTVDSSLKFDDPEWLQIDSCVVSWLYATLSPELLAAVIQPNDDAYTAWKSITALFLDNVIQRATQARQRLHALSQGDLSVGDYCGKIKHYADILRDVGSPLTDQELVITLLGGISDKLAHCAPTISAARPPMRFNDARSFLQQEEAWITDRANKVVSTALLAARSTTSTTTGNTATTPSAPTSQNTGGDRPRKRKKQAARHGNNNNTGSSSSPASRGGNTASWVNPWTGVVQAWPLAQLPNLPNGSSSAGVLGARPGAAPPQSLTAQHCPPVTIPPALYQALTGLTLQSTPPSANDWTFDTGASAHMAGDTRSHQQGGTAPQ